MIKAIVLLTMLGGTGERLGWVKETKGRLRKIPGVKEVYGVLGRYDLATIVEAETLEKLAVLVADEIRAVPGVQSSETLTVLF
jgi:DNA-binding Lrp family transcriptional regulator